MNKRVDSFGPLFRNDVWFPFGFLMSPSRIVCYHCLFFLTQSRDKYRSRQTFEVAYFPEEKRKLYQAAWHLTRAFSLILQLNMVVRAAGNVKIINYKRLNYYDSKKKSRRRHLSPNHINSQNHLPKGSSHKWTCSIQYLYIAPTQL